MAAIVHRCACGHLDSFHTDHPTKDDTRPCIAAGYACQNADLAAPEVIPTWRAADATGQAMHDPVVIEPGTIDGPGLGRLCDCDDCWALYDSDTATAAA
ncbi:hypothetical protein [Amycolatopsis kentuckyensis]|uniref:hypothetical protein n=1 Tax=Amycolatopsis kentuckyensis TaxID=218823 RepID=UPI000A365109|nr:hypothetical protein [Amycolatopsis kentuckyensis]